MNLNAPVQRNMQRRCKQTQQRHLLVLWVMILVLHLFSCLSGLQVALKMPKKTEEEMKRWKLWSWEHHFLFIFCCWRLCCFFLQKRSCIAGRSEAGCGRPSGSGPEDQRPLAASETDGSLRKHWLQVRCSGATLELCSRIKHLISSICSFSRWTL